MNRLFLIMSLLFIFIVPQAWGQTTTSSYPNPYRQTMWNNMTDGVHTMGQTPQQAKITRMKLRTQRAQARLKSINQAAKAKRQAQFKAWQAKQEADQQANQ